MDLRLVVPLRRVRLVAPRLDPVLARDPRRSAQRRLPAVDLRRLVARPPVVDLRPARSVVRLRVDRLLVADLRRSGVSLRDPFRWERLRRTR